MKKTKLLSILLILTILLSASPLISFVSTTDTESTSEQNDQTGVTQEESEHKEQASSTLPNLPLPEDKAEQLKNVLNIEMQRWLSLEKIVSLHRPNDKITVLIEFDESVPRGAILKTVSSLDVEVKHIFNFIPIVTVDVPAGKALTLANLPGVKTVWPNFRLQLYSSPSLTDLKPLQGQEKLMVGPRLLLNESRSMIGAESLWDLGYNGSGIVVAVIDSGIDWTHPDLDDMDDDPTTFDPKVIDSVSFVPAEDPMDYNGHGTACAGIIAGTGAMSGGLFKGISPGAYLMNVKAFDVTGYAEFDWIMRALEYILAMKLRYGVPHIASNSWGGIPFSPDFPMNRLVRACIDAGIVMVFAAGNSGPNFFTVGSPANVPEVISVGATDKFDRLCLFSSRGPTFHFDIDPYGYIIGHHVTLRTGITVTAPSGGVVSPRAGGTYTLFSGTSCATPHVAGVAALLLQAFPGADPYAVKAAIYMGADDLGYDHNEQGGGRVNALGAFDVLNSSMFVASYGSPELPLSGKLASSLTSRVSPQVLGGSYHTSSSSPDIIVNGLANLSIGITEYGELCGYPIGFEYPSGYEHLTVGWFGEGYLLGYNGTSKYTYPDDRDGLINPIAVTILENSTTMFRAKVVTVTDDGQALIENEFIFPKMSRHVTLVMKVINIGNSTLTDVVLKRNVDWDVDTGGINGWASYENYFNWYSPLNLGYAWTNTSIGGPGTTGAYHYCGVAGFPTPTLHDLYGWDDRYENPTYVDYSEGVFCGDGLVTLHWDLGNMTPGESRIVKIVYAVADSEKGLFKEVSAGVRRAVRILFDDTHDSDDDDLYGNYYYWYLNMTALGYNVTQLTVGPINSTVLEGYDVLVLPDPEIPFSSDEIAAIQEFISKGGSLNVWLDYGGDWDSLNELLAPYGITCPGVSIEGLGNITVFAPHPVTAGLSSVIFKVWWPINVTGSAEAVAWDEYGNAVIAVYEGNETGKIVVIADSNQFWKDPEIGLPAADNLKLAINEMIWKVPIYKPPKIHNVAVKIHLPRFLIPGVQINITKILINRGDYRENVIVSFYIDGYLFDEVNVTIDPHEDYVWNNTWTPTEAKWYNFTIIVTPVPGEERLDDNRFVAYRLAIEPLHGPKPYLTTFIPDAWSSLSSPLICMFKGGFPDRNVLNLTILSTAPIVNGSLIIEGPVSQIVSLWIIYNFTEEGPIGFPAGSILPIGNFTGQQYAFLLAYINDTLPEGEYFGLLKLMNGTDEVASMPLLFIVETPIGRALMNNWFVWVEYYGREMYAPENVSKFYDPQPPDILTLFTWWRTVSLAGVEVDWLSNWMIEVFNFSYPEETYEQIEALQILLTSGLYNSYLLWQSDWWFSPEHIQVIQDFVDVQNGSLWVAYDYAFWSLNDITGKYGIYVDPYYADWVFGFVTNFTEPEHPVLYNVDNFTQGFLWHTIFPSYVPTLNVTGSARPLAWATNMYEPDQAGWVAAYYVNEGCGKILVTSDKEAFYEGYIDYFPTNYVQWWFSSVSERLGFGRLNATDNKKFAANAMLWLARPPGPILTIWTDKYLYTYVELVRVTAKFVKCGIWPIENATVSIEVTFPSGDRWFILANDTDSNGYATFVFMIPRGIELGEYTIYGTAYKPCVGNSTAETYFAVQILIPQIVIEYKFEPEAKWMDNTTLTKVPDTITVYIRNVGNGTAYKVNASLTPPGAVTILGGVLSWTSVNIPPSEYMVLSVSFIAFDDGVFPFATTCEYYDPAYDVDRVASDVLEVTVLWSFDFPVGIVGFTVGVGSPYIEYNITLHNYGDFNVTVMLAASALDAYASPLVTNVTTVILAAGETVTVTLRVDIPSWASAPYLCEAILLTGLPQNGGYALEYQTAEASS